MTTKNYKVRGNEYIEKCPKCGNNTEFKCISNQVMEDLCNIWVECKCGYDPTIGRSDYRIEDVWGGVDFDSFKDAIRYSWNDVIQDMRDKLQQISITTPPPNTK